MTASRPVALGALDASFDHHPDGSTLVRATAPLGDYPRCLTERLEHWARVAPDRVFLARRDHGGPWRQVTFAEAWQQVRALAGALLERGLSGERPVAILSGNSIEHGLLALAAMHVGIPFTPISVAYSTVSTDYGKLRHIFENTTPGLVFADNGTQFARAIRAVVPDETEVVVVEDPVADRPMTLWQDLLATAPSGVEAAAAKVGPDTVAKILFTSGSTGTPKGVINTQRMLCANQQQILHAFPFLAEEPQVLVDWTPWNHTFGGNHDFGLIVYNGGTLYIDDGKPVPGLVEESVRNLREISPTFYLNVPKGYEEVIGYLKREPELRRKFFARVKLLFYAGAGLAQHVWDDLETMAMETVGERVTILSGLGSTETAPFCIIWNQHARSGVVGLPARGVELKLLPNAGKLEARVRGPNITPGYWRRPDLTADAFDEEGFYKLGDALSWIDREKPEQGLRFDGRISEDFKLSTGTWVSVGPLRNRLIAALSPYLRDVVIAGIDRDYIAVLLLPDPGACAALCGGSTEWAKDARVHEAFADALRDLAATATGSSMRVRRACLLHGPLSIDAGEVTDKGSLNQRAVLRQRASLVEDLYAEPKLPHIISIED